MYQTKNKMYAIIAILYYIVMMFGYLIMGVLYKRGIEYYSIIQWLLLLSAVIIEIIKDKNITNLGFTKEKIKPNLLLAGVIIAVAIVFAFFYTDKSAIVITKAVFYYLFFIAFQEEIVFRGFIQNYLFGLDANRKNIYIIGAVMFALMHLPFQMFVNDMVSWSYIIFAMPQLVFTFLFHLLMCFITYKRNDILIPTALHFAIDFVPAVM